MEEFVKMVRKMRAAQKDYFRTRHPGYLELSRKLEKEVDEKLEQLENKIF